MTVHITQHTQNISDNLHSRKSSQLILCCLAYWGLLRVNAPPCTSCTRSANDRATNCDSIFASDAYFMANWKVGQQHPLISNIAQLCDSVHLLFITRKQTAKAPPNVVCSKLDIARADPDFRKKGLTVCCNSWQLGITGSLPKCHVPINHDYAHIFTRN